MERRVKLRDGTSMPTLGLGTWPLDDAEVERVVSVALELGYRHVDTAVRYGNERGVGKAIEASGLGRDQVYVTTKLDGTHQGDDLPLEGVRESLDRLGLDYVDLLLIHWPLPERDLYVRTWRAFERIAAAGLARSIGVSNFKPSHLERLAAETDTVPAVNQIQLNPYVPRVDHREYHEANGIVTVSYSPLGKGGDLLEDPVVREVADAHGRTPAQTILRWHMELGLVPIPKSSDERRLRENLDVYSFDLSEEEVGRLGALGKGSGVDSDVTGH